MDNNCDVPVELGEGELRNDGMYNETDWMLIHYYHSVYRVVNDIAGLYESEGKPRQFLAEQLLPNLDTLLLRLTKLNMLSRRSGGFTCSRNAVNRYVPHSGKLFRY